MDRTDVAHLATMRGFLGLALPLAAGFGVNWAMQFTNRLFLSWYSPDALAASLPAGMLVYTMQAFFTVSVGYVGAFAAQHLGADEPEEVGAMAWPMLWLAVAAGLLALLVIPLSGQIFRLYGAEPAVTSDMATLGGWYLAETLPAVLFSGLSGWFGGIGRTRLVLLLSVGVCVLSVLLNRWLIFGGLGVPALGLHGAGLATLLASTGGTIAALAVFFAPAQRQRFGTWRRRNIDPRRWWRFCRAAVPRGATEALEMVSVVLFTVAVAHLGSESLAANNLAFSLYLVFLIPLIGLGQGVTIAVGQAVGAGRIDVARAVARRATVVVLSVLAVAAIAFLVFPQTLLRTHVDIDPLDPIGSAARWERIIAQAVPLLAIAVVMAFADGLHIVWRFAVQGAGDTRWPLAVLTSAAFLVLGLPALALTRLVPPEWWQQIGIPPLTGCWLLFACYLWLIAAVMWWRFHRGPWATMSLRK
jgi:MATE family multidrug resistance protein